MGWPTVGLILLHPVRDFGQPYKPKLQATNQLSLTQQIKSIDEHGIGESYDDDHNKNDKNSCYFKRRGNI